MTCKEVISVDNSNQFLIGQRWVNKTNGEIETNIDLKAIELRKIENGWKIMVCFIPKD